MIGYVTLGTNDLERGAAFYDKVCGVLGTGRMMEGPKAIAWGKPGGGTGIGLTQPFDGQPASVGNGVHIAFLAGKRAQVDEFYRLALAHGGSDAGPPGLRPEYDANYSAAFVRAVARSLRATARRASSKT